MGTKTKRAKLKCKGEAMKPKITPERLRELLSYDPETGVFIRLITTSNRAPRGSVAGRNNGNGYLRMMLDGQTYYAHWLAWFYVYGTWPDNEIDHRDGDGTNNRIDNLRQATHAQNGQNQPLRITNKSGMPGVSWSKLHSQWEAYIWVNLKKKYLGLFDDVKDAGEAYLNAKQNLHSFQPVPRDIM